MHGGTGKNERKMMAVIRIAGEVGLRSEINETLKRLNLKTKYSCVVFENPSGEQTGMVKKVRDFVAFGEIDNDTYKELTEKRGGEGKTFFRLHPPRKGIRSKVHFPKGVLGNHGEKINELIRRML